MSQTSPSRGFASRALPGLLIFLSVSAAYLYAFPQSNVFYAAVVSLHALAGIFSAVLLAVFLFRLFQNGSVASGLGWVLVAGGAVVGLVLIKTGTPRVE